MKKKNLVQIFKQIRRSVLVLLGTFFLFSAQLLCVQAQGGGTFYHRHIDACYETENIPCTEHYSHIETVNKKGFCSFCNKDAYLYEFVTVERCPYMGNDKITDIVEVCQECGNIIYISPHTPFPAHTKEVTNLTCGKPEDTPIASVSFSQSTTKTTINPVILAINIDIYDEEFSLSSVKYSFDGGNTWGTNSSRAFTENGVYVLACKDLYGTIFQQSFSVNCIVKPVPEKSPVPTQPLEEECNIEEPASDKKNISKKGETSKKNKIKIEMQPEKQLILKEIIIPSCKPEERGITMEGINWSYMAREPISYLRNSKEERIIETEERVKKVEPIEEIRVVYRLAPIFVRVLYLLGCIFLLIAIIGCIWYAYRNLIILYEVEDKERFFISLLIGMGKRERKVYISEKKMKKIGTKELLLTCFYCNKNKNIVVYTPLDKIRIKWEKQMRVHI